MGDAQLARIGTDVKGRTAYLHPIAARAWAAATAYILAMLGIDLGARIIQAYGQAAASAGTHGAPPCAVDIRVWGLSRGQIEAVVRLLRECGWIATWYRDWAGNLHIHAVCDIETWSPARYQCTAVKAGYDGLGAGGRKGRDTHPKPSTWRTAAQGAAWAEAQINPPKTDFERFLDTMDEKTLRKIIREEAAAATLDALRKPTIPGHVDANGDPTEWAASNLDAIPRTAYRLRMLDGQVRAIETQVAELLAAQKS